MLFILETLLCKKQCHFSSLVLWKLEDKNNAVISFYKRKWNIQQSSNMIYESKKEAMYDETKRNGTKKQNFKELL